MKENLVIKINDIEYNVTKKEFSNGITNTDVTRYFKGIYTNKNRFEHRLIKRIRAIKDEICNGEKLEIFNVDNMLTDLLNLYDNVKPFSYVEAFKINDENFKSLVFGSINITDMIKELGHIRIATDGKKVKHKTYSENGEYIGIEEYDNIYEVHEVDGEKLGINEKLYVLKCWCTSTNKEHWLWIDEKNKNNPLEAIASTFFVHKKIIPYIKEIKRQGDILLTELTKDIELTNNDEMVALTAEQYFGFLTAQS